MRKPIRKIFILLLSIFPFFLYGQLPCITDNSGCVGKHVGQLELYNGIGFHNEHRCIENSTEITPVFTYGVFEKTDIVIAMPFLFTKIQNDTSISNISGFSDASIEMKYCFFYHDKFSLAIKPGISIPSGKYTLGLGSGKISGSVYLIFSFDFSPVILNSNVGYLRNANKCGDALDIWHFSVDIDYKTIHNIHFVLNSGIEKNPDLTNNLNPVFGLFGLYYCFNDNFEISAGYKKGLTQTETNHAFVYGLTFRF